MFNGTGMVNTDFRGSNDLAHGVTIQNDGKIVMVGSAGLTSSTNAIAVARWEGVPLDAEIFVE